MFLGGHDYRKPLRRDQIRVDLIIGDRARSRSTLVAQVTEAGTRYGFTTVAAQGTDDPLALAERDSTLVLRHLIFVADREFDRSLVEMIRPLLADAYHSVDLVFAYPTIESSKLAAAEICSLKAETADLLNFPRPDSTDADGWSMVSDEKIVEESISNTVRIKYRPSCVAESAPVGWVDAVLPFFRAAAQVYCRNSMYHRSTSDGCLALRTQDGLAVTATKTHKDRLDRDRIVLVHDYDETTNTVSYSGPALPSGEAVELSIVAAKLPSLHSFIHTHASALFVRNPRFADRIGLSRRPYGVPATGYELASVLDGCDEGMVIMAEHGELFFHTSTEPASLVDLIDSACRAVRADQELPDRFVVRLFSARTTERTSSQP